MIKTLDELKSLSVDVLSLPEVIDSATAKEKGHVNRLYEQESSLNTLIYQNKDATKTAYIFSKPIKYVDSNGLIRDKSTKISKVSEPNYLYGMTDNSVKVLFPRSANAGIQISYNDYSIIMAPDTSDNDNIVYRQNDNSIEYTSVFEDGISLVYKPRLNGLKEDVLLYQKPESNLFAFKLVLTNLTPMFFEENWYLINPQQDIIASFQEIVVSDSAGNTVLGAINISTGNAIGEYNITVAVPEEFVENESTVFPVYVDPTIDIWETGGYYNEYGNYVTYDAITDTGIYSTSSGASNAQSYPAYHKLGYYSTTSSNGRIIYKLYDFYGEYGQYKDLHDYQIGAAALHVTVGSTNATTVYVNPMTSTWNTSTYGTNPVALFDSTLYGSYSSTNSSSLYLDTTSGERVFDITDIVKGWTCFNNGTSTNSYDNPSNGFMLRNSSTSNYRQINSIEKGDYDVYVEIDYSYTGGDYYVNNLLSGQFLKRNGSTSVTTGTYSSGDNPKWFFEYIGDDTFIIHSKYNTNYVLYGSGSTVSLSYLPSNPTSYYKWVVTNASGGGVIIKNCSNNKVLRYDEDDTDSKLKLITALPSGDSNYKKTVWGIVHTDNYVNLSSFTISLSDWLAVDSVETVQLSVYPSNATWKNRSNFKWKSDDTDIASIDDTGKVTAHSNGYTNIRVTHKPTGKKQVIQLVVGQMMDSSKYYHIKNVYSDKYAELETVSTQDGVYIEQYSYHNSDFAKWKFIYYGSGYYYIQSKYSNKYIGIEGSSSSSGAAIIQTSTMSNASRWKVLVTSNGNYKFVSKLSGLVISLPNQTTSNGVNLQQIAYSNDSNYIDEWIVEEKCDVSLIAIPESYDRSSFFPSVVSSLSSIGYNTNVFQKKLCMNHNFMINRMENSKITVIRTHGSQTSISTSNESVDVSKMSALPSAALSYSELIIYGACKTGLGKSGSSNLVNATHSAGASIVIGFEKTVYSGEVNQWCQAFFTALSSGKTVLASCSEADTYVNSHWHVSHPSLAITTDSWYIAGDSSTVFS